MVARRWALDRQRRALLENSSLLALREPVCRIVVIWDERVVTETIITRLDSSREARRKWRQAQIRPL